MAKYYFVTTLLPELKIGQPIDLESRELDFILRLNLTHEDFKKVSILRRFMDIENIRRFWQGEPIELGSNFDEKEIEENILLRQAYPRYVFDFIDRYEDIPSRLKHFTELLHTFFHEEMYKPDGFVERYLRFEWEWRLTLTALRAKHLGRDLVKEMQFEDPENPFVQQILEQKDAKSFEVPDAYKALKIIFETKETSPIELYQAIAEWRFNHIEEMVGWHTFSIDRILGYVVQLEICETWLKMDKRKGLEIIEEIAGRKEL